MSYEVVQLSKINVSALQLVKESTNRINEQDHARWVFKENLGSTEGRRSARFVKIWNPKYVRKNNVLKALEVGFYDETTVPALAALIFHKGVCRGYITEKCRLTYELEKSFYEIIKRKTITCEMFAIQFSRYHMGLWKGRYSLFDLDGVHPLKDLTRMPQLHSFFDDEDYAQFVVLQFRSQYPNELDGLADCSLLPPRSWKAGLSNHANAFHPALKLKIWHAQLRQRMKVTLRSTHTHLIEF